MGFTPFEDQRRWIPAFAGMTSQGTALSNPKEVPMNARRLVSDQAS
jgi:hypothetical protein